jgi:hypothetical protein
MRTPLALAAAGLLAISYPAGGGRAQTAIESQRVTFAAGADSIRLQGQLKGDQTVDYTLRAGAGQTLTVELKGSNLQNYFNVIAALAPIAPCLLAVPPAITSVASCPAMATFG